MKKHSSPTPEVDLSLEDALLHGNKENVSHDDYSLPSPKLSKIVVNMSRSKAGPAQSSLRKTDGQEKRKKRGLTVSFVQNSETDNNTHKPGDSTARKLTRHPTQRNMGASLVDSLNTSRYGAMDRRYAQTHKEGKFPTGYPGEDPRLGYDWIAGLLDASESYLSERDDEYFDDMKEFRRVNFEDCHRPKEVRYVYVLDMVNIICIGPNFHSGAPTRKFYFHCLEIMKQKLWPSSCFNISLVLFLNICKFNKNLDLMKINFPVFLFQVTLDRLIIVNHLEQNISRVKSSNTVCAIWGK